jgi:hypothetical protein
MHLMHVDYLLNRFILSNRQATGFDLQFPGFAPRILRSTDVARPNILLTVSKRPAQTHQRQRSHKLAARRSHSIERIAPCARRSHAEFPHFVNQSCAGQAQARCGAVAPADQPVGLVQNLQGVVAFGFRQGARYGRGRLFRHLRQYGQGRPQHGAGRQDNGTFDKILQFLDVACWPIVAFQDLHHIGLTPTADC